MVVNRKYLHCLLAFFVALVKRRKFVRNEKRDESCLLLPFEVVDQASHTAVIYSIEAADFIDYNGQDLRILRQFCVHKAKVPNQYHLPGNDCLILLLHTGVLSRVRTHLRLDEHWFA